MNLKTSSNGPVENMNACFLCHEKMIVSIHSERGYLTQKMQNQIWIQTSIMQSLDVHWNLKTWQ